MSAYDSETQPLGNGSGFGYIELEYDGTEETTETSVLFLQHKNGGGGGSGGGGRGERQQYEEDDDDDAEYDDNRYDSLGENVGSKRRRREGRGWGSSDDDERGGLEIDEYEELEFIPQTRKKVATGPLLPLDVLGHFCSHTGATQKTGVPKSVTDFNNLVEARGKSLKAAAEALERFKSDMRTVVRKAEIAFEEKMNRGRREREDMETRVKALLVANYANHKETMRKVELTKRTVLDKVENVILKLSR